MSVLEVSDDGFDGGGGSPLLSGDPDAEFVRIIVAAIDFVGVDAFDLDAGGSIGDNSC